MKTDAKAVAADLAAPARLSWAERMSDAANPILVREVLQAMSGRVFRITLGISVVALTTIGLVAVAYPDMKGRDALIASLACLAPIVIFILPLQAFASMRQEVAGGTADQLLLTRLSPVRIVVGKLLASMAMFVLFLGMFSPLIALTYLLRGIDVLTIAIVLGFSLLASLVANSFAIAMAALGRVRWLTPISLIATIAGLSGGTIAAIAGAFGGVIEVQREISDPDFIAGCIGTAFGGLFATALFGAVAQALLAHEYENRSTPFRWIAVGLVLFALVWCVLFVDAAELYDVLPGVSAGVTVYLSPILIGIAAERERLSPRVARYVPKSRVRGSLLTPLLPGGGRGVLFGLLLLVFLAVCSFIVPTLFSPGLFGRSDSLPVAGTIFAYVAILMVFARRLRRSSLGVRLGFWGAYILTFVAILFGLLLSLAMMAAGHGNHWTVAQIVNVPWTIVESSDSGWIAGMMIMVACAALLFVIPDILRGRAEVAAAAERRQELDAS